MKAPKIILNASKQPYLNIGIMYGGVKMFGIEYTYIRFKDVFLRQDYEKKYYKHIKAGGTFEQFIELIKNE